MISLTELKYMGIQERTIKKPCEIRKKNLKGQQIRKRNKQMIKKIIKKGEKRKISCLAEKPTCS